MERQSEKRSDAIDLCDKLEADVKKSHGQIQTGERMTFTQLADLCIGTFYKPAVIVEGRKIAGVRSLASALSQIKVLKRFFGSRLIAGISTESLTDYKFWRLKDSSSRTGTPFKIATINRELSIMRKMMRYALGNGWVLRDIFFNAKVIESSAEIERNRLLTPEEEARLIAACVGEREVVYERKRKGKQEDVHARINVDNPHLKAMIILAIDSGMRKGEILRLRWQDLDFHNNIIRVVGSHTKTERERFAPFSRRAQSDLAELKNITLGNKPFPFADIKRSFATAKRVACIEDLHFHDLRRTAITRWIMNGVPLALAGKIAGHSVLQTTMKHYTSTDADMVRDVAEKMSGLHELGLDREKSRSLIEVKEFVN